MGMSASQARLIQLEARQSNLEYQGQQINQERTILSQQCTDLYNSLLTMTVPTPPSTQDFTTVQYSGSYAASDFTIGNITPYGNTYTVDLKYQKVGGCIQKKGLTNVVKTPTSVGEQVNIKPKTIIPAYVTPANGSTPTNVIGDSEVAEDSFVMHKLTDEEKKDLPSDKYPATVQGYKQVNGRFEKCDLKDADFVFTTAYEIGDDGKPKVDEEGNPIKNYNPETDYDFGSGLTEHEEKITGGLSSVAGLYVKGENGQITEITETNWTNYFEKDGNNYFPKSTNFTVHQAPPDSGFAYTIGGNTCTSLSDAFKNGAFGEYKGDPNPDDPSTLNGDAYDSLMSYIEAIKNTYPEFANASWKDIASAFQVYFETDKDGNKTPIFVKSADFNAAKNTNGTVNTFEYIANGKYTQTDPTSDCKLEFDTSGRISSIYIPYQNKDGSISYREVELTATKVTDEAAYRDAYNKYEYAMYEYDKQQQAINAKTEIIQQQDRNLELKLQRLDNERQQITTEIEALNKVIDDNIEASYKTFSG